MPISFGHAGAKPLSCLQAAGQDPVAWWDYPPPRHKARAQRPAIEHGPRARRTARAPRLPVSGSTTITVQRSGESQAWDMRLLAFWAAICPSHHTADQRQVGRFLSQPREVKCEGAGRLSQR